MRIFLAALCLVFISFNCQCSTLKSSKKPVDFSKIIVEKEQEDNITVYKKELPTPNDCDIDGFTLSPIEHIVVKEKKPFVVQRIQGLIKSEVGEWPEGYQVLFEIRKKGAEIGIIKTLTNQDGTFEINNVEKGDYCFKATIEGWQSVYGMIIVSPTADPNNQINLIMLLGV